MKTNLKKTNYVVVVDYEEGQTLSNCWLLGWDSNTDWYDCDTSGDEILTKKGNVKKNDCGLIGVSKWRSVYVSDTEEWCRDCSTYGNKEGYDCTVCKLEKSDGDWNLIPV